MESFKYDTVPAEKAATLMRSCYRERLLHTTKNLFRSLELCLAVAVLAWATNRLPFAIQFSGNFLRRLSSVVSSHLFVFLLSNAIIAALFLTAARLSCGGASGGDNAGEEAESYFVKGGQGGLAAAPPPKSLSSQSKEANGKRYVNSNGDGGDGEIIYEDKEMISSCDANDQRDCGSDSDLDSDSDSDSDSCSGSGSNFDGVRVYRRTKSEKLKNKKNSPMKKELRRAETAEKVRSAAAEEEEMSDEEFQRAVEEFIEKHLNFRRQESLCLVVQHHQTEIEAK